MQLIALTEFKKKGWTHRSAPTGGELKGPAHGSAPTSGLQEAQTLPILNADGNETEGVGAYVRADGGGDVDQQRYLADPGFDVLQ